jgi:two-component system nitrogen regulation sensor histidine kinase NtrY
MGTVVASLLLYRLTNSFWTTFVVATAAVAVVTIWSGHLLLGQTRKILRALEDGVRNVRDGDFSIRIAETPQDELASVVQAYNELISSMKRERQNLSQRALLLETIIQETPLAFVLTDSRGTVLYSNLVARHLLHRGRPFEGLKLQSIVAAAPEGLRDALLAPADTLFTMKVADEPEIFHLAQRGFTLNGCEHRMYLLKQLTREINAQEVATWKKAIRTLAHEINNSLAPLSSLAHSAKRMLNDADPAQLTRALEAIQEGAQHLQSFMQSYAQFAKLPQPRIKAVSWPQFIYGIRAALPCTLAQPLPALAGTFDEGQMSQVLVNIIKNALEAGSPPEEIVVGVTDLGEGTQIQICDRGSGMPEAVLESALLPFYSTKPEGTGLGLALCREIVEAHGGHITVANRAGGGMAVTLWLPRCATAGDISRS